MKRLLLLAVAAIMAAGAIQAKTADEIRIYINPGHGSWGPNDRPMATIPYPMLPSTGRPDTCGFYESNTDLWKCEGMEKALVNMGIKPDNIMFSRRKNGPYPYRAGGPDAEKYNRSLSEICEEVDANNMDMFISVHSNAAAEASTINYPLYIYRGYDNNNLVAGSRDMCAINWGPYWADYLDPQSGFSATSINIRGDIDFYHSSSTRHGTKGDYTGYLGVLKHGVPGFLQEGYFHTYQPARHRALNKDYCYEMGVRMARGVANYWKLSPEKTGYIEGTVKDLHERIVNDLFHYAVGTNDQWLPLNDATVTLSKDGKTVATYAVDQNYNGIFYFPGLEPGNYTLRATASGYKTQGDYTKETVSSEYQNLVATSLGTFTVKANSTTYAKLYLEKSDYEVPKVVYSNYPDPAQPSVSEMPDGFNFAHDSGSNYGTMMAGDVKKALMRNDTIVVLTNDGATPHLYLINANTKQMLKEMSTSGIVAVDASNAGDHSALNDIAFAADGQLIGINSQQCQFSDAQVKDGYKRGTVRLYKWATLDAAPQLWVTTQSSNNFYNCDMGKALAVSGAASQDCHVLVAGTNANGTYKAIRFLNLGISNNTIVSSTFSEKTINDASNFTEVKLGYDYKLVVSPQADNQWVIDGSNTTATEFAPTGVVNQDSPIAGRFPGDDEAANGGTFFRYAKRTLYATPYTSDGKVAGIKLYDVTNGLANAQLIRTSKLDITPADAPSAYMTVGVLVDDADLQLMLIRDKNITKFYTRGLRQPVNKGIYAYDLNRNEGNNSFTFTFKATDDATGATLVLTPRTSDAEEISIPVGAVKASGNEVTVEKSQLAEKVQYDWAVAIDNSAISSSKQFFTSNNSSGSGLAIDLNTESSHYGNVYISDPYNAGNRGKGIYAYNPALATINNAPYLSQVFNTVSNNYSPYRLAVHPDGTLYIADWSDPHAGIWKWNIDESNVLTNFFEGTAESTGRIVNGGTVVGGSASGLAFAGSGSGLKLLAFLEDYPTASKGNTLCMYNIGDKTSWNAAPSKTFPKASALMPNTNVNVQADDHGIWLSQTRGEGNNSASAPAFIYVDYDDNVLFNSSTLTDLNGSWGAGLAISPDRTMLAVANAVPNVLIYSITWTGNVPSFTYKFTVTPPTGSRNTLYQLAFDPAGNLLMGNRYNSYGFTMPSEARQVTTKAPSRLYVEAGATGGVGSLEQGKTVESVKYVNVQGIVSNKPFDGVNIVITRYTDGSQSTEKIIK